MPSLDFVFDLTEKLQKDNYDYMLIVMTSDENKKGKSKKNKKVNYLGQTFFSAKDQESACALIAASLEFSEDFMKGDEPNNDESDNDENNE